MSLWGKTDDSAGAPKYWSNTNYDDVFLVDEVEAAVSANRAKGLKTPGWNTYSTYTSADGNTRHKVETLVAMDVPQNVTVGDEGIYANTDIEDATVADS